MPRFKAVHKGLKLLPVDFFQVGSFEHAVCYLVDHDLDLTVMHDRYKNDAEGAPAFDPGVLLKIVLLAYSRGIVSSRRIETRVRRKGRAEAAFWAFRRMAAGRSGSCGGSRCGHRPYRCHPSDRD